MYEALNNRVIAIVDEERAVTASGIILAEQNNACARYRVCYTNSLTKELQDKIVYAEARYKNYLLPEFGPNGEQYVVIPREEILAVKA